MFRFIPPIHKEGYPFIVLCTLVTVLFSLISSAIGVIGTIITIWCVYFFRDPRRISPAGTNWVLSPADGIVTSIRLALPPKELELGGEERYCISIFLNIFDVHVNRVPAIGTIKALQYRPGKFLNANSDKASEDNERQCIVMTTEAGKDLVFVQIAGLIARRIVCDINEGQQVKAGERFGIIRFGSRMDVYLPEGVAPIVMIGQRMLGGETILADLDGIQVVREGIER